ncbi:AraC family transcriptional regulator [Bradyrhizobium sp. LHD-71]|uniref:AraC family transcriptional regulator n=1 Tax=Bradyrhizobium sp. LHD-71 TaxID=3072141 RepID=UPI00280E67B1|nr:AraC family transcriptional regulator [Bradyrhizobium sp. LHD-71]MDQ8728898.1 AraC family transcriptional regulator [Bradyrhizobium sp. LHD-71]
MDPLEEVFRSMRVESALYGRLEATAPWAVRFTGDQRIKFGMVARGACWLSVDGERQPIALRSGDCFVLTDGRSFSVADDPATPPRPCIEVLHDGPGRLMALGGGGPAATLIAGWFGFDGHGGKPLFAELPPVLHVGMDEERARALQATLDLLALETSEEGLGAGIVTKRLADIILVQTIRTYVHKTGWQRTGWLAALTQPRLGVAVRAMHHQIDRAWTVDELASIAGMSRSAFAAAFREKVGEAPHAYLTRWRMYKAGCLIRGGRVSLAQAARAVGYRTDSAFNRIFQRHYGVTPAAYRRTLAAS